MAALPVPLLALVLLLLAGCGGPGAAGQRRKEVRLARSSPRAAFGRVLAERDEGRAGQGLAGWLGLTPGARPEGSPQGGKVLVSRFFGSA